MDPLMITLIIICFVESMLLIAQGEAMSEQNDIIGFLEMENEELRRKGEKHGEKNGTEGGHHKDQITCDDSNGQGGGLDTGEYSESSGGGC